MGRVAQPNLDIVYLRVNQNHMDHERQLKTSPMTYVETYFKDF